MGLLRDTARVPYITHAHAPSPVTVRAKRHPVSLPAVLQSLRKTPALLRDLNVPLTFCIFSSCHLPFR